jgi:hypothetical protein
MHHGRHSGTNGYLSPGMSGMVLGGGRKVS